MPPVPVNDLTSRTPVPREKPGAVGYVVKNLVALVHARGFEFALKKPRQSRRVVRRLVRPGSGAPAALAPIGAPAVDKFFTVDVDARPGINHLRFALELLVREAVSLGRTPVAFRPRFDPRHNLGHDLVTDWDRYIDLERIELVDQASGFVTEVKMLKRDEIGSIERWSGLWFERGHMVTAAENWGYDLLVRHNMTGLHVPTVHDGPAALAPYAVRFQPSRRVLGLVEQIVHQLGEYCAVHVRRDDMLEMKDLYPNLDRDTQPDRIAQTLGRVLQPGAAVYIMTNERNKSFFAPLKEQFRVFQYFDFPALRDLVETQEPDNFLLFEVEKQLFERAQRKVHTFTHPEGRDRLALTSDKGWA